MEQPPPARPPYGVAEIIVWELAAYLWRAHLPDPLLGGDCARCGLPMPCFCWRFADAFLAELLRRPTEAAAERTRELPQAGSPSSVAAPSAQRPARRRSPVPPTKPAKP